LNAPYFITGIGTGIGKTVVAAIIAEALEADYWKPVQSGSDEGTDNDWVRHNLTNTQSIVHPEVYCLGAPLSPHLAARMEGINISIERIREQIPHYNRNLIVEGAGGLMAPLNDNEFVKDLILALQARVVLVTRKYLGSLNHSLLTASACAQFNIPVLGWVFNGYDRGYEEEIMRWSGYPRIASIPETQHPGKVFVKAMAESQRASIMNSIC